MIVVVSIAISCTSSEEDLTDINLQNEDGVNLLEQVSSKNDKHPRPPVWADCMPYIGIVVPATFKPESKPFDELYAGGNGFRNGKPLISDSKPGDQDYNGGRWHMNVLKDGVDPDKYANACSAEDLDLNDFTSTPNYFECPLLPLRGNNR